MTNLKSIATTLAILGSGSLAVAGCEKAATETPGGAEGAPAGEGLVRKGTLPGQSQAKVPVAAMQPMPKEKRGEGSCSADAAESPE